MIDCSHGIHGICAIATGLCNRPVPLDYRACEVCSRQNVAFGKNSVTASLAVKYHDKHKPIDRYLIDLAANRAHLAGHTLERYIHRWLNRFNIDPPTECNCQEWIAKMNVWGIKESLQHLDEIVDHLYESTKTTQLSPIVLTLISKPLLRRMVKRCLLKEPL